MPNFTVTKTQTRAATGVKVAAAVALIVGLGAMGTAFGMSYFAKKTATPAATNTNRAVVANTNRVVSVSCSSYTTRATCAADARCGWNTKTNKCESMSYPLGNTNSTATGSLASKLGTQKMMGIETTLENAARQFLGEAGIDGARMDDALGNLGGLLDGAFQDANGGGGDGQDMGTMVITVDTDNGTATWEQYDENGNLIEQGTEVQGDAGQTNGQGTNGGQSGNEAPAGNQGEQTNSGDTNGNSSGIVHYDFPFDEAFFDTTKTDDVWQQLMLQFKVEQPGTAQQKLWMGASAGNVNTATKKVTVTRALMPLTAL